MDDNASKGGSYIRQKDGSLKLVERTAPAPAAPAAAPETPKDGKKENADG